MKKLLVAASIVNVIAAFYFVGCLVGGIIGQGLDAWHMAYYERNNLPKEIYISRPQLQPILGMYSSASF